VKKVEVTEFKDEILDSLVQKIEVVHLLF